LAVIVAGVGCSVTGTVTGPLGLVLRGLPIIVAYGGAFSGETDAKFKLYGTNTVDAAGTSATSHTVPVGIPAESILALYQSRASGGSGIGSAGSGPCIPSGSWGAVVNTGRGQTVTVNVTVSEEPIIKIVVSGGVGGAVVYITSNEYVYGNVGSAEAGKAGVPVIRPVVASKIKPELAGKPLLAMLYTHVPTPGVLLSTIAAPCPYVTPTSPSRKA